MEFPPFSRVCARSCQRGLLFHPLVCLYGDIAGQAMMAQPPTLLTVTAHRAHLLLLRRYRAGGVLDAVHFDTNTPDLMATRHQRTGRKLCSTRNPMIQTLNASSVRSSTAKFQVRCSGRSMREPAPRGSAGLEAADSLPFNRRRAC